MQAYKLVGQTLRTFTITRVIGKGAWAFVFEAVNTLNKNIVALKAIPVYLLAKHSKLKELIDTEINVLKQCHNENVIGYVDDFRTEDYIFIATEYCNGGDLENYLKAHGRLSEDEATTFLKQMINGFKGLHEVNAMHRDFKSANVLLHNGICKIADLGFAKQLLNKTGITHTVLGTSLTMAPEILYQKSYGMYADIWSIGVVYYQLIYGIYPYLSENYKQILEMIKTRPPSFKEVAISDIAKDFILKCLVYSPIKRISWRDLYDHPLIKAKPATNMMLYGLTSRIDFGENKKFYENGPNINKYTMYNIPKPKGEYIMAKKVVQIEYKPAEDYQQLIKYAEKRYNMKTSIAKYYKMYLSCRNKIMFIFKFVFPNIYNITHTKACHALTMFITGKNAYFEMKYIYYNILNHKNFLYLEYFIDFVKTDSYAELGKIMESTVEDIHNQIFFLNEYIENCSNEVREEFDITKIRNKNWKKFVEEIITSYEFLLTDSLETAGQDTKQNIIKVIYALSFTHEGNKLDIEDYDRKAASIPYTDIEKQMKNKLSKVFNSSH